MIKVTFITSDKKETIVQTEPNKSVMRVALDNNIDGILAECGGSCSCATCHCYINEDWYGQLPPLGNIEKDLLECVVEPGPTSRLSCQVLLTEAMDGIVINIPESQY